MNDALADYVREVADRMYLRDWTLFTSDDPESEPEGGIDGEHGERNACIECTFGRRAASVWLNPDYWRDGAPEDRRQTVVHELIHAHMHGAREVVANATVGKYPTSTAHTLMAIFDVQMEYAVDTLADIIAPLMPLPPDVSLSEPISGAAE